MAHWLGDNYAIAIKDAPTIFAQVFGYQMVHRQSLGRVELEITQHPGTGVNYRFLCPFSNRIDRIELDGQQVPQDPDNQTIQIPAGTQKMLIQYS